MTSMQKYALCIEYDGTHFKGWQKQKTPPIRSVEETLEAAISYVAHHDIEIVGAGRTDTGVHAFNQIAHFETSSNRSPYSWIAGINSNLPEDCNVKWIKEVPDAFHARHSAISRIYKYYIHASRIRSALNRFHYTWVRDSLDIEKMKIAAQYLVGEHDFSAFRSSECQSHSPFRSVHYIHFREESPLIEIEIKANAFLHHMVRNMVGTLIDVGKGKRAPDSVKTILESLDRTQAGMTAHAQGLYLYQVNYPQTLFNV